MLTPLKIAVSAAMLFAITATADAKTHHKKHKPRHTPVLLKIDKLPVYAGTSDLSARRHHRKHRRHHARRRTDANGNTAGIVRSNKTGALARVNPTYVPRFQGYIDDLEATGSKVLFMGGYRRGRCSPRHKHSCGMALDVCQLHRGVVDARCNLPNKVVASALAMKNGLFEGALWCDGDFGHAQVGISSEACRMNLYAAVRKMKDKIVATVASPDPEDEAKAFDYSMVVVEPLERVN